MTIGRAREREAALESDLALELRGVRAGYGTIEVLRGVDLAVPYGKLVALACSW